MRAEFLEGLCVFQHGDLSNKIPAVGTVDGDVTVTVATTGGAVYVAFAVGVLMRNSANRRKI